MSKWTLLVEQLARNPQLHSAICTVAVRSCLTAGSYSPSRATSKIDFWPMPNTVVLRTKSGARTRLGVHSGGLSEAVPQWLGSVRGVKQRLDIHATTNYSGSSLKAPERNIIPRVEYAVHPRAARLV